MKGVVSGLLNEMFLRCCPKGRAGNTGGDLALHVGRLTNHAPFRLARKMPVPKEPVARTVVQDEVEEDAEEVKIKLKNCPFCGGDSLYTGRIGAQFMGVKCQDCNVEVKRCAPEEYPEDIETDHDLIVYTHLLAIRAWNRRA